VALLQISSPTAAVPIKPSRSVKLGQQVFTLGYPNVQIQGTNLKMTEGSISSTGGIQDDSRQWQISVPVQPGNSGGPLFDEYGNVFGIVVSKLNAIKIAKYTGDLPQNINYAVESAYAMPLLEPYVDRLIKENPTTSSSKTEEVVDKVKDAVVLIICY
jgi:serine protease Do